MYVYGQLRGAPSASIGYKGEARNASVRFDDDRLGLVEGTTVYDVTASIEAIPSRRWPFPIGDALIAHLSEICSAAQKLKPHARKFDLAQVELRSPLANPSKIMAAPAN